MGKTSRLDLWYAFVSRHCGRVRDAKTPDAFFRDASIALLLLFDNQLILELMKLGVNPDERALPRNTRPTVPTMDNQVQERYQFVWKKLGPQA